jgi:ABC-type transport system involved in cytochrome c biogenesis permease subunit
MTSIDGDQSAGKAANGAREPNDAFLWGYLLFALCCEIVLTVLTYLERTGGSSLIRAFFLFVLIALVMIVGALGMINAFLPGGPLEMQRSYNGMSEEARLQVSASA